MTAMRPGGKPAGTWALPKGLIGPGERAEATALREVTDETGVTATQAGKLGDIRYGRGDRRLPSTKLRGCSHKGSGRWPQGHSTV